MRICQCSAEAVPFVIIIVGGTPYFRKCAPKIRLDKSDGYSCYETIAYIQCDWLSAHVVRTSNPDPEEA